MTAEERLEKIEVELAQMKRRNRGLLIVIVVCLAVLTLGAAAISTAEKAPAAGRKIIQANEFDLTDTKGKTRAALFMLNDNPFFGLLDKNDKPRVLLKLINGDPGLVLFDKNDKLRVALSLDDHGPALRLLDEDNKSSVDLRLSKDGPSLSLSNNGRIGFVVRMPETGPIMSISDFYENMRLALGLNKGSNVFFIYDVNGKIVWSAP